MDTEENVRRYWAFISYSHADKAWADWLHKALEHYPIPRDLVGKPTPAETPVPKRFVPIFRDREELPTATDLGAVIDRALRHARFLVVICSPRSAKSQWVNQEIVQYKQMHGEERVLCMIVDGEPWASDGKPGFGVEEECFPEAVRHRLGADGTLSAERTEPIAADAREGKDGKEAAVIKLMAGLLGVGFDALRRREEAYQRRRLRRLQGLSALFALLFMAAAVAAVYAVRQKREVQRTLSRSDLQLAVQAREEQDVSRSKAYLARSLRSDPENKAAAMAAWSSLAHLKEHPPVGPVLRHPKGVLDAVGAPDGTVLVTAAGRRVYLWSREGNVLLAERELDGSAVNCLALMPGGGGVVAGTGKGLVHFLRFAKLESAREPLSTGADAVRVVAWRPDGEVLAVGLADGADERTGWVELRSGQGGVLSRTRTEKCVPGLMKWSPDGSVLMVGGASPQFYMLRGEPMAPELTMGSGKLVTTGFLFVSNERVRVLDYVDGWQEWDLAKGEKIGKPKEVQPSCVHIAVAPDGRQYLGVNRSASAYLYDAENALVPTRPLSPAFTVSGGYYLDASHVLLTGENGMAQIRLLRPSVPAVTLAHTRDDFTELVSVSPDGKTLAVCSQSGSLVRLFERPTMVRKGRPVRFPVEVHGMDFMADGERLVGLGWDGHLHQLWWENGLKTAEGTTTYVPEVKDLFGRRSGVGFNRAKSRLAIPGEEEVLVVDTENDKLVARIPGKVAQGGLAWSPDGELLAVSTEELVLRCYDTDGVRNEEWGEIRMSSPGVKLAWSPDGGRIAVLGTSDQVVQFDVATKGVVGGAIEPGGLCNVLEWTADGAWLFTSTFEGRMRFWDPEEGLAVATFPLIGTVHGCRFLHGGQAVLAAGNMVGLVPMPELGSPPSWVANYLEASGGARLSRERGEPLLDPDAWMNAEAGPGAGEGGVWADLYAWLSSRETDRPAAVGSAMSEREAAEIMAWSDVWTRVVRMQREMERLFGEGGEESTEKALGLLDEAIALDPDRISLHEAKVTVGKAYGIPALELDGYIGVFESGDATLRQALEAKLHAVEACFRVDPPNPEYAKELVKEVLAEEPGNEEAKGWAARLEGGG